MDTHRLTTLTIAIVVLIIGAPGCRSRAAGATSAISVIRVIDGDTIVARIGDTTDTVRLLGIDTPEIAHHGQPGDCFGAEAAARTGELLPVGARIELLLDAETRDRYGRLLAYVIVDHQLVNATLVEEGYARTLSIAPNTAVRDRLADTERRARLARRGLWGACQ